MSVPNWIGDVVMATPALAALRRRFAGDRIVHLMRPYVSEVLRGCDLADAEIFWPQKAANGDPRQTRGTMDLIRRLRAEHFDLAVLLTNSFRSAAIVRMAGIGRRAGYARDGRGWLLNETLVPPREKGQYVPIPALDYYNALARRVGCDDVGLEMRLAASAEEDAGIISRLGDLADRRPLVALNPGANYGSAKCWPAEKYAALSDRLVRECGATVVASLSPKEREIGDRLAAAAKEPVRIFVDLGIGLLRALVKRCDLLVTNDTGPRHFAPAFGVPVVTVFGSSDPAWTITRFEKERIVKLDLDCQPCMERTCPLKHHACMRDLTVDRVFDAARSALAEASVAPRS
ncbi:MAG TPA: lipopolysaccharide heptosyltransferase II [Phycisphaerae bacterium]|nr:lipopolysaccharide heptosyltransferase II [Phycisphaerae bacterium]HRW52644.1 lipopolysaccharide heptosyltransferase II [Phycisphaerae bacterium]